MQDAWRAYLELAMGLTEASRRRAEKVARDLLGKGGATAAQLQSAAEDLLSTSRANRESLAKLVRYELDRALGAVGLATSEEVVHLATRVRELERRLRETSARVATGDAAAAQPPPTGVPATEGPAKRVPVKKVPVKKAPARKAPARKATKAVVKKQVAKKAAPRRSGGGAAGRA
jgi:polyhydroxyalkanoate synthesis regulator phasin